MTEKELLELGYRKYPGKDIDVFFNLEICIHSGNCVRGLIEVFNTKRKPWIIADNAHYQDVKEVIERCPSGALKYILKDDEPDIFKKDNNRFYMLDDFGKLVAEITFSSSDKIIIIDHTFVDPSLRGQGIGGKLVSEVVKIAIDENKKIIPLCPFAKRVFEQTESYQFIWHK